MPSPGDGPPDRAARDLPSSATVLDWAFFIFGGVAAAWFAVLLLEESLHWRQIWFLVVFWAALAYLVLPRLHRILTRIYIPDYFMGRTRTSDGLFGDAVNLAFRGGEDQLRTALEQAGWTAADPVTLQSSRRIVTASLLHRSYPQAPVSPLFLFDRQQDFAYQQELDGDPRRRHHVRFWRCPEGWMLPGGIAVDWLAAAEYDSAVGLSFFTLQVTHRIGADIDRERDHVVSTLTGACPEISVDEIRDFSTGYHSRNGGGDSFVTDGDLPVLDVGRVPVPPGRAYTAERAAEPRRPLQTSVGAGLVFLRALAALVPAWAFLAQPDAGPWRSFLLGEGQDVADLGTANGIIGGALLAFACVEAALGIFILRGGNRSRLAAMSLSAAAILGQVTAVSAGGPAVPLEVNLPGYSLDVLLILALSSPRARLYAHRGRGRARRLARPGR
ncbi:hypothetical protein BN1051_00620 [Arthrobacter saudimassiliensis]|uniref:LssY-like C-terminal domain-containing protein n=1 Tax=Arthrobacter saudimassiliensis TaxID=1461584 RepID=A0A078MIU3_9MICC|nr:hypothetical protein BN1051_00620 [Arthrobacter saudimassiliensis]